MNSKIGIEVAGVTKYMKKNLALDGISLSFLPGMLHGIIGPDGAGKTTLLRTLIGLLKPDAGSILFSENGKSVDFKSVRPGMAYMPQQQSLYPDLSCSEHLDFFRDLYQIPENVYAERKEELFRITRLSEFRNRAAGKLSGGMYKKLGLMCALLQSPSVVLLDEPTTGVDPISRREFWDLLYKLVADGILVLVTTAYMDEAERCARVHLFDSGKLLATGEPRAVLKQEGVKKFEDIFIKGLGQRSKG